MNKPYAKDINLEIFSHLPLSDLLTMRLVCRQLDDHAITAIMRQNKHDARGRTLFHHACIRGEMEVLRKYLSFVGHDPRCLDATTLSGDTPVMLAARNLQNNVVRLLDQHGADLFFERSKEKGTLLMDAFHVGNAPVVDMILAKDRLNEKKVIGLFQALLCKADPSVEMLSAFWNRGLSIFRFDDEFSYMVNLEHKRDLALNVLRQDPGIDTANPNFLAAKALLDADYGYPESIKNLINTYCQIEKIVKSDDEEIMKQSCLQSLYETNYDFIEATSALLTCNNPKFFSDDHKAHLQAIMPNELVEVCSTRPQQPV